MMSVVGILLDENIESRLFAYLRTRALATGIQISAVGEPLAPGLGTKDPDILIWCEKHQYVLVTDNRISMPPHLAEHLKAGRNVPGIIVIKKNVSLSALGDHLLEFVGTALPGEIENQINFATLPSV